MAYALPKASMAGLDGAHVLIVDDNRVNRQLLAALLDRTGHFSVETAEDGDDALRRIEEKIPDIILLDLMMPRLDGFEMCRLLRDNPKWQEIPVLVQSSLNRPEDRARAFAVGATDYVAKPINVGELMARIRVHLQNRGLVSSLQQFRRKSEAELQLARRMQERLLPDPARSAARLAGTGLSFRSLFSPSSELGGDLWGYRRIDVDHVLVYIVDFSGHGVGAALNTFRLHAIIEGMDIDGDPARFLSIINDRLRSLLPTGQFATMLAVVIDLGSGRCRYAGAGATSPMYWTQGMKVPLFGNGAGLPLGIATGVAYEARELPLPPDGRLFLYSDGALEIPTASGVLDEEGLSKLASRHLLRGDERGGLDRLSVELSSVGPIEDDLTLVLVQRD